MGEARTALLDDLAVATGTQLLSALSATTLKDMQVDALGAAGSVEVSSTRTILFRPKANVLDERLRQLDRELQSAKATDSQMALRSRIANLKNAVGILRIGADTPLEMNARMAAANDAVRAVQAAAAEGVVPGGGVAFVRSCQAVRQLRESTALDVRCGVDVVLEALTAPFRQILINAAIEPRPVLARVAGGTGAFGFNAATDDYGDLQSMGVLDPAAVTLSALRNAASVAVQLLSTEVAVASGEVV
jgi:chaperonin GroEL